LFLTRIYFKIKRNFRKLN